MEQGRKQDQTTTVLSVLVSLVLALFIGFILLSQTEPQKTAEKPPSKTAAKPINDSAQSTILALPEPPKPPSKKVSKSAPKPAAKPATQPAPKSKAVIKKLSVKSTATHKNTTPKTSAFVTKQATSSDLSTGRPLLRILEHGKGPNIEIAWPNRASSRDALYKSLNQCFGMTVALMDDAGNLYRSQDPTRQRWNINLDHYSGFVRQPSGAITRAEHNTAQKISRKHPNISSANEVRIFPRRVDAILLGSLHSLIGSDYTSARTIRAEYTGSGRRLMVQSITVDGKNIAGRIDLSRAASCR